MKKILIIKDRYGESYHDASTTELVETTLIKVMRTESTNIQRFDTLPKDLYLPIGGKSVKMSRVKYEEFKLFSETIREDWQALLGIDNIVKEVEQNDKEYTRYMKTTNLFDEMVAGNRPVRKSDGKVIGVNWVFGEIFDGNWNRNITATIEVIQ